VDKMMIHPTSTASLLECTYAHYLCKGGYVIVVACLSVC